MELEINFSPKPPNPEHTIECFFHLAKAACQDIREFQPDLVIVLAHGGWGLLWAVQALWEEGEPFPPVLVTNIGREKLERYYKIRLQIFCDHMSPYVAEYAGLEENGFFLAWVSRQVDWQDALREQVLGALHGIEPKRVLVLDDANFVGSTYRIVLRLLGDIFPACETRMLAGDMFEWRYEIAERWLRDYKIKLGSGRRDPQDQAVYEMVPGTEDDGGSDSLKWRPLTPGNKVFEILGKYLPFETWLELPTWAEHEIKEKVAGFPRNTCTDDGWVVGRPGRPVLNPDELLMQFVWINGSVTSKQAADLQGISPRKAGNRLKSLAKYGILQREQQSRQVLYSLTAEYRQLAELL